MSVPFRQSIRMGAYLARQRLARREKFPLLVELEPLFQCNLACAGCGKIQHPEHVLRRRMTCSGCWILPQPAQAKLHWNSGSSSTSSGNLSLIHI